MEVKPTEDQITAAARALSNDNADICNVNREDNWMLYGDSFRETAKIALEAAFAARTDPTPSASFEEWASEEGINNFHFNHCHAAWQAALASNKAPQDGEAQTRYVVIGYGETDNPVGAFIQTPEELLDAVLGMIYMHPSDAPADIREAYQKDLADEDEWSEGIWRTEFEIGGIVIYDIGAPLASNKAAAVAAGEPNVIAAGALYWSERRGVVTAQPSKTEPDWVHYEGAFALGYAKSEVFLTEFKRIYLESPAPIAPASEAAQEPNIFDQESPATQEVNRRILACACGATCQDKGEACRYATHPVAAQPARAEVLEQAAILCDLNAKNETDAAAQSMAEHLADGIRALKDKP